MRKVTKFVIFLLMLYIIIPSSWASYYESAKYLKIAYPEHIKEVTNDYIDWHDGTRMLLGDSHPLLNLFHPKKRQLIISDSDIRHDRYEPFFKKMYGDTAKTVRKSLVTIYWMPHVFGKKYPLKVTTVNNVHEKLARISSRLEKLPKKYHKYLKKPGGTFYWRKVKGESSLSAHSFGIAIDINLRYANYWLWDYLKLKKPMSELRNHQLKRVNHIPQEIVEIFEDEGFFWGGHWYFYDTMHFEYRPDLIMKG